MDVEIAQMWNEAVASGLFLTVVVAVCVYVIVRFVDRLDD